MSTPPKVHFPDLIFGRPCCSAQNAPVSHDLQQITCKRCQRIVAECERATAQRKAQP